MSTLAPDRPVISGSVSPYSVVRLFERRPGGCSLTVESPHRVRTRLDVACRPDRAAVEELRRGGLRPIAVRVDLSPSDVCECTALFTSGKGPQRVAISLGAALALCADGCHTVITRR